MRKIRPIFLTYKTCVNIVQCLNIICHKVPDIGRTQSVIISRKLYYKLVEHDLIDDCYFNFSVSKFFHNPFPYSLEL